MRKILLIEDDGFLVRDLITELRKTLPEHEVKAAYSYSSAIALWKKYEEQFNCIVIDLNINPHGLVDNKINDYFPIYGILILNEICKGKSPEECEHIWGKTIIYSAFIDHLKEKKSDFKYFDLLILVSKTEWSNISESIKYVCGFYN